MKETFDFYGNNAGDTISSQKYPERFKLSDLHLTTDTGDFENKAGVNEVFYNMIIKSDLNIEDYRIVQFEDDLTGARHITDYVVLTRGLSRENKNFIDGIDTIYIPIDLELNCGSKERTQLAQKIINDEKEKYAELGIKLHQQQLGIHSDGAITWCKNNL